MFTKGVDVLCCSSDADCPANKPFCNPRDEKCDKGRCTSVQDEFPLTHEPFIPPLRAVPFFYIGFAFCVSSAVMRCFGRFSTNRE